MAGAVTSTEHDLNMADLLAANIGDDRDPYGRYEVARGEAAVQRVNHLGADVVMVYSYEHASTVLRDQERFSARINGKWMRPLLGRTILEMDEREHFVHRRLIGHAFRPSIVGKWEDGLIRPTVVGLLDKIATQGHAEMVREFTWQMPVRVFASILGVPSVDYARWQQWAIDLERAAIDRPRGKTASEEVRRYFEAVVAARRQAPSDDLISDLVAAEIEGERLPDDVLHGFLRLLVPAGAATTYRLMGNLMLALLSDPPQLEAVRADRSLVPEAVEEALRWEAPVQFAVRECLVDTCLGDVDIPAGAAVTACLGAANRDPRRFPDPDRYDVRRTDKQHLTHMAFGDGVHRCLGEHLARLEATVALNMILDRFDSLELDPDGFDPHVQGYAFRSPNAVPIRFEAA
ncbi:MAG: cytochrome P450 [Actinobacteria bacterium]|nr:MAG: cytochrome P450 [Actinomycetota bacterium]